MKKLSKESVNYRESMGAKHCGNCSMWRPYTGNGRFGICTLVAGEIVNWDLCDRWATDDSN